MSQPSALRTRQVQKHYVQASAAHGWSPYLFWLVTPESVLVTPYAVETLDLLGRVRTLVTGSRATRHRSSQRAHPLAWNVMGGSFHCPSVRRVCSQLSGQDKQVGGPRQLGVPQCFSLCLAVLEVRMAFLGDKCRYPANPSMPT